MNFATIVETVVIPLASALGGGGIIYWRYTRQLKKHEADLKGVEVEHGAADNWHEFADRIAEDNKEKDTKIDKLSDKVDSLSDVIRGLKNDVAKLTLERCTNYGCIDREPPMRSKAKKAAKEEASNE